MVEKKAEEAKEAEGAKGAEGAGRKKFVTHDEQSAVGTADFVARDFNP